MKEFIPVLRRSWLFAGVTDSEIETMLSCLDVKARSYKKGEYVFRQGERIDQIALVVRGELYVQQDDYWGDRSIIHNVSAGELFGEAYLAPECGIMLTDVIAALDSTVLFFNVRRIITTCSNACRFHTTVVQNLFFSLSEKNQKLMQKLGHMSRRTTREKLMSYLSEESRRHGSGSFSIPFNRQQLADFLSVDRSAMSNELCKMRDEGLLEFEKNQFTLVQ